MVKKIGKYELGKTLGSGSFGKVKYATDTTSADKTPYAIKVLDRKQIEKENMQEQLKNEIAIMKILKHTHVVKMFEVIQSPQHIYIVLELVTGGELFDRIVAAKRFDENTARRYFQQLVFGVYYCHQQGVSHRDLKPENLLLDANDSLKISDFGLSALSSVGAGKGKLLMTTCGTPNYVAPEVLKEKGYDGKLSDIWSCGVILFVMLAGYLPFDDPTMNGLFVKIERGEYRMPKQFSLPVKSLITKMLNIDPAKRITIPQIMDDPWFTTGVSPEELEKHKAVGKKVEPTAEHLGQAITENAEGIKKEDGGAAGDVRPRTLTAFELASRLVMGSLSPLVTSRDRDAEVKVRVETQFMADGKIDAVTERVMQELDKATANPKVGKNSELKCHQQTPKGIVQFTVVFQATICPEVTVVEVRRSRGDTLEFHGMYRRLVASLVDICPTQPPRNEVQEEEL